MTLTKDEEFERRNEIRIKQFLKNKRAGSQEKKICETIIQYLFDRNIDPGIAVDTQGWVMAIDVLGACEGQIWESPKGPKPIHRRAIERCLTDLEMERIIDKRKYLYPAKRKRPGPEKKRENVFYRLCLAYVQEQNWEKLYFDQVETFLKVSTQRNLSVKLIESLKMTISPDIFDDAVKEVERVYGIKKHVDTTESTAKEIIKAMAGCFENGKDTPRDPRIRTTDEVLKSILDNRSKINAQESAERAVQHKINKEAFEAKKAKERKELSVNHKKKWFKENF